MKMEVHELIIVADVGILFLTKMIHWARTLSAMNVARFVKLHIQGY